MTNEKTKKSGVLAANATGARKPMFRAPHFAIAALVAIVTLALYMTTITGDATPGMHSRMLFDLVRDDGNLVMRHMIWRKLIGAVTLISGANFIFAVNFFTAIVSAMAVGMMYLFVSMFLALIIDRENLENVTPGKSAKHTEFMRVVGGVIAAAALAFNPPFWFTATITNPQSFYILWLLTSMWLLIRFALSGKMPTFYIFVALYSIGMTQTSCFISFVPLIFGFALYSIWSHSKITPAHTVGVLVTLALGLSFLFISAWEFYGSAGSEINKINSYWQVFHQTRREIFDGAISLMFKGWMIYGGLNVAPFLVMLLTGHRAINGERDWSFFLLNGAMLILSLVVVLDTGASPWVLFGGSLQAIPYVLTAIAYGYLAAYVYSLTLHFIPEFKGGVANGSGFAVRFVAIVLFAGSCGYMFFHNHTTANHKQFAFGTAYADAVIDNMEWEKGRKWLVTNGYFDEVINLRAKEKNAKIRIIGLSPIATLDRANVELLKRSLPNPTLQNSIGIGFMPLLSEWIGNQPEPDKNLALCLFPDLWGLGGYEFYTKGLSFCGATTNDMPAILKTDYKGEYFNILEKFEKSFGAINDKKLSKRAREYKRLLTTQISFIGNNCGYLLDVNDAKDDAFEVYARVLKFDPDNVSALLNYAAMIRVGIHPGYDDEQVKVLKDDLAKAFEDLAKKLKEKVNPWALSRTYGYVNETQAFVAQGWTWLQYAQPSIALKAINQASQRVGEESRTGFRIAMANIYMMNSDVKEAEILYLQAIKDDPGNKAALLNLMRINSINGNFDEAEKYFKLCQGAGIRQNDLIYEQIAMCLSAGGAENLDMALKLSGELIELEPNNPRGFYILAHTHQIRMNSAKTQDAADQASNDMLKTIEDMERVSGADDFQVLFFKGTLHTALKKFLEARNYYELALQKTRQSPVQLLVLERILTLDFTLGDKKRARERARTILERSPDNYFANYTLGSLALDAEEYVSAEAFLERADRNNPRSIVVINDLAMAKLRLRKFNEAEAIINRAFDLDSTLYAAYDTLGEILYAKGEYHMALEKFELAMKYSKETSDFRVPLHVAAAAFKVNEHEKFRSMMESIAPNAIDFKGEEKALYIQLERDLRLNRNPTKK